MFKQTASNLFTDKKEKKRYLAKRLVIEQNTDTFKSKCLRMRHRDQNSKRRKKPERT